MIEGTGDVSSILEEELLATVRLLSRTIPAPRHDPFFGLDRVGVSSLHSLQRLSHHGDFRKYVLVLDAGADLGGCARWLASRYGCRVLAFDPSAARVAIGHQLSLRASLGNRVSAVAADFECIPVRDGAVTQVASVEALHRTPDRHRAIAELFRTLRPGCTLAIQDIVRRSESVPAVGSAWRYGTEAEYVDAVRTAGFIHVQRDDATGDRAETSPVVASARETFARRLAARVPAGSEWLRRQSEMARVESLIAEGDYRVLQLFATRPSI